MFVSLGSALTANDMESNLKFISTGLSSKCLCITHKSHPPHIADKMSSAFDNTDTAPQVHGAMQPTVIEHTEDPDSISFSVDEVVKPTEAERAPSNDNATKAAD